MKFTWKEATEKFQISLPGYQPRVNQDHLATQVETAFRDSRHLFAQAGCGTGKSFVGVVGLIRRSKETGKPGIYATATKALQDQLASKDLPFLQNVLGDFKFTVLKGRSNYVCLAKVDELENLALKNDLRREMDDNSDFSGEIVDLQLSLAPQEQAMLSTTSDECPGKKECPFGKVCFSELAKDRAKESNVVVVNHAVLAADLAVKAAQKAAGVPDHAVTGILPDFGGVVVDEAHEMNSFVTNALGGEVTSGSYHRLGTEVAKFLADRNALMKINDVTADLFNVVQRALDRRQDKRSKTVDFTSSIMVELAPHIESLINELDTLRTRVANFQIHGNDQAGQKKKRLVRRIENAMNRMTAVLIAEDEEMVRWLEIAEGKKGNVIKWAPMDISDFLRENLLTKAPVVFTSATLAEGDNFDFMASELGVDRFDSFDAGTPFNFKSQARTFIPQIAHPAGQTANQWRSSSIATTAELLRASNGRALLLFTSRVEMEESYRSLAPLITNMGHVALKQGDEPNKVLKEKFDADEHSVLFGLDSFMTGIDIQGDSLRLVVINKAPFVNPNDVVFTARCNLLTKKNGQWAPKGGFYGMAIPTMILKLTQAYGRLIRTVSDQGVVAILDSRLYGKTAKNYGGRVMKALPDAPVITDLSEAVNYLESLEV